MPAINADTREAWQQIANDLSRQRPDPGKFALVFRGRKLNGQKVQILRRMQDKYTYAQTYRYASEASAHMTDMRGREGYVCEVLTQDGKRAWIKACYLACEFPYTDWTIAFADAIDIFR